MRLYSLQPVTVRAQHFPSQHLPCKTANSSPRGSPNGFDNGIIIIMARGNGPPNVCRNYLFCKKNKFWDKLTNSSGCANAKKLSALPVDPAGGSARRPSLWVHALRSPRGPQTLTLDPPTHHHHHHHHHHHCLRRHFLTDARHFAA